MNLSWSKYNHKRSAPSLFMSLKAQDPARAKPDHSVLVCQFILFVRYHLTIWSKSTSAHGSISVVMSPWGRTKWPTGLFFILSPSLGSNRPWTLFCYKADKLALTKGDSVRLSIHWLHFPAISHLNSLVPWEGVNFILLLSALRELASERNNRLQAQLWELTAIFARCNRLLQTG